VITGQQAEKLGGIFEVRAESIKKYIRYLCKHPQL
jgi:hypothetical protein